MKSCARFHRAMSNLGPVRAETVEFLIKDFVNRLSGSGAVTGSYEQTHRLLLQFLPKDKVDNLMEELRGPAGRTMWDKLGNVNEQVLANYLKNEYPQTVSVILSKIKSDHSARVLTALPPEFALEVIQRMLRMEPVQRDILEKIESTLRTEFMTNLARTSKRDSHEQMAAIFNNFDRQTEGRFIALLEDKNKESADRIRSLMFVFEDLSKLDPGGVQTLLRSVDKEKLGLALKGANDEMRNLLHVQHVRARRQDHARRHGLNGPGQAQGRRSRSTGNGCRRQGARRSRRDHARRRRQPG